MSADRRLAMTRPSYRGWLPPGLDEIALRVVGEPLDLTRHQARMLVTDTDEDRTSQRLVLFDRADGEVVLPRPAFHRGADLIVYLEDRATEDAVVTGRWRLTDLSDADAARFDHVDAVGRWTRGGRPTFPIVWDGAGPPPAGIGVTVVRGATGGNDSGDLATLHSLVPADGARPGAELAQMLPRLRNLRERERVFGYDLGRPEQYESERVFLDRYLAVRRSDVARPTLAAAAQAPAEYADLTAGPTPDGNAFLAPLAADAGPADLVRALAAGCCGVLLQGIEAPLAGLLEELRPLLPTAVRAAAAGAVTLRSEARTTTLRITAAGAVETDAVTPPRGIGPA